MANGVDRPLDALARAEQPPGQQAGRRPRRGGSGRAARRSVGGGVAAPWGITDDLGGVDVEARDQPAPGGLGHDHDRVGGVADRSSTARWCGVGVADDGVGDHDGRHRRGRRAPRARRRRRGRRRCRTRAGRWPRRCGSARRPRRASRVAACRRRARPRRADPPCRASAADAHDVDRRPVGDEPGGQGRGERGDAARGGRERRQDAERSGARPPADATGRRRGRGLRTDELLSVGSVEASSLRRATSRCGRPAQARRLSQEVWVTLPPGARQAASGGYRCAVPAPTSLRRSPATAPLRIAVLAPIAWRTPPRHYGPWELFASLLTEGLVGAGPRRDAVRHRRLGHHGAAARHRAPPAGPRTTTIDPKVAECLHIADVFERADEFDVIHNGFDFLPLTYSGLVDTPVVTTIHGFSSPRIVPVYERYDATTTYVAISDADRHPRLHYAATIHHGIDIDAFALHPAPRRAPALLRADPPRQGHGATRSRSPAAAGRRAASSPASSRTSGTSTSEVAPAPRRRPGPLRRPGRRPPTAPRCSAAPTPCCTSSTSTSRSGTAWSRRWPAAPR